MGVCYRHHNGFLSSQGPVGLQVKDLSLFIQDMASCPPHTLVPTSPHRKVKGLAGLPITLEARPLCPHCVAGNSRSDYSPRRCVLFALQERGWDGGEGRAKLSTLLSTYRD